jgi:hypothetical protein
MPSVYEFVQAAAEFSCGLESQTIIRDAYTTAQFLAKLLDPVDKVLFAAQIGNYFGPSSAAF